MVPRIFKLSIRMINAQLSNETKQYMENTFYLGQVCMNW